MNNAQATLLGERLLFYSREQTIAHLLSPNQNKYFSGWLDTVDLLEVQRKTQREVVCSVESGEYFFKLKDNR